MHPNNECLVNFEEPVNVGLFAVRGVVSAISTLCIILVIAAIFLFQKHHFFTQRLILYLAFSSLFFSIEGLISIFTYKFHSVSNGCCVFIAFFDQVTSWWVTMAMFCIVLDIFIKVVTFKQTERLEWYYVVAIFVLPVVLISWIPFINSTYGPAGPLCWIRSKNLSDCEYDLFGVILQFALYYIPLFLTKIIVLIMLLFSLILLHKKSKSWVGKYDPHIIQAKMRMQTEVRPLFVYPIVILCMNILSIVNRTYDAIAKESQLPALMWYISFTMYKLQGVFITLAFALDKETRKKLTRLEIMAALRRLTTKKSEINEYLVVNEVEESTYTSPSFTAEHSESTAEYRWMDD